MIEYRREDVEAELARAEAMLSGLKGESVATLSVNVTGSATVGKDQGNETSAHLGFRAAF